MSSEPRSVWSQTEERNNLSNSSVFRTTALMNLASPSYGGIELAGHGRDYAAAQGSPLIIPGPITYADHGSSAGVPVSTGFRRNQRVRLRVVETEREYYLKLMNLGMFMKMAIAQAAAALVIVLAQIILYCIGTNSYKIIEYVGAGLWGPQIFFISCWLAYFTTQSPSACTVATALGFQIVSFFASILLLIFATIALTQHGKYISSSYGTGNLIQNYEYDPEVGGRIFSSFIILGAVCESIVSLGLSIMYCKLACCSRANANESGVFDVEAVRIENKP